MSSLIAPSRRRPSRRELLAGLPLALTGVAALGRTAFAQSAEPEYVEVKTAYGRLRGANRQPDDI